MGDDEKPADDTTTSVFNEKEFSVSMGADSAIGGASGADGEETTPEA